MLFKKMMVCIKNIVLFMRSVLGAEVYFGKSIGKVPYNSPVRSPGSSIIFFPLYANKFCCGLSGIISFKNNRKQAGRINISSIYNMLADIEKNNYIFCKKNNHPFDAYYLGGEKTINSFMELSLALKNNEPFFEIFTNQKIQNEIAKLSDRLKIIINSESKYFSDDLGHIPGSEIGIILSRINILKDADWCFFSEIAGNIKKIKKLFNHSGRPLSFFKLNIIKEINAVMNSLDRLEVRGRDSAGISMMFVFDKAEFEKFNDAIKNMNLRNELKERFQKDVLVNRCISIHETKEADGKELVAFTITYKTAAEVGGLGDNVNFLRNQIENDSTLQLILEFQCKYHSISAHTRWASVGAISEPNCHPVDNNTAGNTTNKNGIIHVCLNGDIDNYRKLKKEYESRGELIPEDITTDTKIIPLVIEKYVKDGFDIKEAFRLAVNDFEGSHAISMHTDLAPGKMFLAQKGSGQAVFIGMAEDHYMPVSEVYGFIEETPYYIKMDGESIVKGKSGDTQGQIFILNQESGGDADGIEALYYDGTSVKLDKKDIKYTSITSRDVDRQGFAHYFLKEIFESPNSVEKTLLNRWKIEDDNRYAITLDESAFPKSLKKAIAENQIRRIFFVGQGTAGIAAMSCANIMNYYMNDHMLHIKALKASELSGFYLYEHDDAKSMADTLVVAISQSGTTTDTNRAVDMVKKRGAHTLAIVNRRDSDITFKVDGVLYTSSGRDIEMSVASTKAFYSQIIAGAILGLFIATLKGRRNNIFIAEEINQLLRIPDHMRTILAMQEKIEKSAKKLAAGKTYWATVGSGPNKASANEIRIKLSELCYKTISSDYIEDKKHIDLSSEPLIIVCAAGTRGNVIGDVIKDTAIFKAHKAAPVVIADEGERRFDQYAEDVFNIPIVSQHLAPILNTMVGHIWGYYAALSINKSSQVLYRFKEDIQKIIDDYFKKGFDVYEVILENVFREKIAGFYNEFRRRKSQNRLPTIMGIEAVSDLTLLLKYLSGKLPVSDFELDFGKKGTALNMLNALFECLGESINYMSRPIDAIKHQAKTVTVGTSRISEKVEGIFFDILASHNFNLAQLTPRNVLVLKNLQGIISNIEGAILYRVEGLNLLGEPTEKTTIKILTKEGVLENIPSRVEKDFMLKGTKRIIVRQKNVYIGKGRRDNRSIVVIPVMSASLSMPNIIKHLLLLNVSLKENVLLVTKIKALGGKHEHIKNIVQENSITWNDEYLELVKIHELFGRSAEKISEYIISRLD